MARDDAPVNKEVEDTAAAPDAATDADSTERLTGRASVAATDAPDVANVAAAAIDVDATAVADENTRQTAHGAVAHDDRMAHAAQHLCRRRH